MLDSFMPARSATVMVVGDVILDRYVHGETTRISPEAPVPVVRVRATELRAGGAANVAMNLRALGISAHLAGVTGRDESAASLAAILHEAGVTCSFAEIEGASTITKLRVISQQQQLLRLDYEPAPEDLPQAALLDHCAAHIRTARALIISDYAKGTAHEVEAFIAAGTAAGIPVLVDPKGRDFHRYRGATVLTPNLAEFENLVGHCTDEREIARSAEALRAQLELRALVITRGAEGVTLVQASEPRVLRVPARRHEIFDVTGAGDTVIATLAAAMVSGYSMERAVELANIAAGMVVEKLGTATVGVHELNAVLVHGPAVRRGVLDRPDLMQELAGARARGERIVFTNGCFDLIHAGHVRYLQQAAGLGDRLLVAVNDDASVTRLKGEKRPVSPLGDRMEVLAALGCVDWVTPFSEDTPAALIAAVAPDVLVKGGDYAPDQVVGAMEVRAAGGQVVILPYAGGRSSSALLDAGPGALGRAGG